MFREIDEVLTKSFKWEADVWASVYSRIVELLDFVLIVLETNSYVVRFSWTKSVIVAHRKDDVDVLFDVYMKLVQHLAQIVRLIYSKGTLLSISSYSNIKDSLYLPQVLDLEYLIELLLESFHLRRRLDRDENVVNVK